MTKTLNNMKRKITWTRWLMVMPLLIAGCYPQGPETAADTDVVITSYNSSYNFKSKGTFAIPDKVVKITGNAATGDPPVYVPTVLGNAMIAQMTKNMVALGYTKVDISASPDLILVPSAMETTTVTYWYDYWGWYWGSYYPGWGYPWYPYPGYVSSYTIGTLVMLLVDPTKTGGDGSPVSQWAGAAQGVLTSSYDVNRINKVIDQAFTQSPYLKK